MPAPSPDRKIDLPHMAFYRAWLQGIDLREAADRYLAEDLDLREAKSTIVWMREALVRAARRFQRLDYARLLRIQIPNQVRDEAPSPSIPTLEEFGAERNAEDFYSQEELLEIYLEEYPEAATAAESPREKRLKRLIERQIQALHWAEQHLAVAPRPTDSVVEWFDTPMAERLIVAGIRNLEELQGRIAAKGYRWWDGIRQLGEIQAGRIVKWLRSHEASIGPLPAQALSPARSLTVHDVVRPAATDIMPLESFLVPTPLDGAQGENRAMARPRIDAVNDHQAINAWLTAVARNDNTRRSYRREAERLLLWAILERGKPLASLNVDDAAEHQQWLFALGRTPEHQWRWRIPQARWIGRRNIPRWSPDWRPYEGTLALRSQQQSYTILKSMFEWLVKMRYLDSNPWDGTAKPNIEVAGANPDLEMTHALSRGQWDFIMGYLDQLPMDARSARLRFVLPFAYATGLRLAELVDARAGRLYSKPLRSGMGVRWMLKVLGKGQKWRTVPMPSTVMHALGRYFGSRGLADPLTHLAEIDPETALITTLDGEGAAITPSMLYKALKRFFADVAGEMRKQEHFEDAHKVAQASTHWLRHTRGSHSADNMPLNMLQRLLGHASLATTTIYTSADDDELYEVMEKELAR
jgi:site-specific recombinase XerD